MEAARASIPATPARLTQLVRDALERRRLEQILSAVHQHELRTKSFGQRPHDLALYRRMREILVGRGGS
jgi:hypothetical protein